MAQRELILNSVEALPDLSAAKTLVFDTETSGLNRHTGGRIVGFAIGDYFSEDSYYIPIRHAEDSLPLVPALIWLRLLCDDPSKQWIMHNGKFDVIMLKQDGIEIKGKVIDTMLMAYVANTGRFSYALDTLTKDMLPSFKHEKYEALAAYIHHTQKINIAAKNAERINANYGAVPKKILGEYALEDLSATKQLAGRLNKTRLLSQPFNYGCLSWSQGQLLENEFKLAPVLGAMEDTGVLIDVKRCMELRDRAESAYEHNIEKMAYEAGAGVDPLSWKDMWVKFEKAGGKVTCWTKTKEQKGKQKTQQYTDDFESSTKRPNWNAAALMSYLKTYCEQDERVYRYLLAYREAMLNNRIKSTYFDAYLQMCDFKNVLHGQFIQTGTRTGRLSSRKPNLQNLAKTGGTADQKSFEKFIGEKDEEAINRLVRSLFIARPGRALVSCDFSQIEYRAAAWYSQDKDMISRWIANPRIDYHEATMELLGLDRDLCKTINFGTLYGMSAPGLAASLAAMGRPTSKAQAQEILNLLWEKRPALKDLINTIGAEARRCNYIQNAYGRVVDVPIGREYVALNYLVQGHCGDMMRETLVRLYWIIQKNGWDVKMLLTVHDEILFEMPIERVAELAPKLAAEMCKCPFMGVPVLSDIEVGTDWGTMVSLDEWVKGRAA